MKFSEYSLQKPVLDAIKAMGIEEPTKIQEQTIPPILEGKDVIGESPTGSGKTLAFGIGIAQHVKPNEGIQAIVLTPTRELAQQVNKVVHELTNLHAAEIYGGVAFEPQLKALSKAEVIVATPGRLLDHLSRGNIDTSKVHMFIMDEADRMFDMGFIEDVEQIIQACPKKRQTLFFSATISPRVKSLGKKYLQNPLEFSAGTQVDPSKLKQVYYDVDRNMKLALLIHLLKEEKGGLVMVFCNTRAGVDFVARNLKANDVKAIPIHGGLSQNQRTRTIGQFNDGKTHVLVCTDVAARGLHIENVSHVYNYDISKDAKEYVHRIGRTARAGEEGKVINLICQLDFENFDRLLRDFPDFSIENAEKPYVPKVKFVAAPARTPRPGRGGWQGQRSRGPRRGPPRGKPRRRH